MKPFLSIVSGTFQRLDYARAMVQSVRDQLPPGFPYEVIFVDGGSKDGTVDWCEKQSDVRLVQHGQLLGALKAFGDGARAARGELVLLANDDVLFHSGSIVRAVVHLLKNPRCGAVAFADNRNAPGKANGYGVQSVPAVYPDGTTTSVFYAQVGLFRKALGDTVGWWGDTNPIMQEAWTYGGDNFLSAGIWGLGFTVDAVEGVAVDDRIPADALRERNVAHDAPLHSPYHRCYPNGVRLTEHTAQPVPDTLRILYAPLFSPGFGRYKTGLYDALAQHGQVYELNYVDHRLALPAAVAAFQPHLILTQFHDATTVVPDTLAEARKYAPEAVVVNWDGDVYEDQLTAPSMLKLLEHVDLQLVVNADVLPFYAEQGVNAAYWQIAAEPVPDSLPDMPAHDVLFMGNAYSAARLELEAVLRQLSPNVGLYGFGWQRATGNTFYNFAEGAALYRNCKIAIGDNQYNNKGFVSNRLFEALANGAFLLHQTIPGLEELTGLVDGVHYVAWTDYEDLRAKVKQYLQDHAHRRTIAQNGEAFVRDHHSFDSRVAELFEYLLPRIANGTQREDDSVAAVEHPAELVLNADGIPR